MVCLQLFREKVGSVDGEDLGGPVALRGASYRPTSLHVRPDSVRVRRQPPAERKVSLCPLGCGLAGICLSVLGACFLSVGFACLRWRAKRGSVSA